MIWVPVESNGETVRAVISVEYDQDDDKPYTDRDEPLQILPVDNGVQPWASNDEDGSFLGHQVHTVTGQGESDYSWGATKIEVSF